MPADGLYERLLTGFFPDPLLHGVDRARYYGAYVQSYLERDIRQVTSVHDLGLFRSFLELLAARCGSLLNLNELARDCGISFTTARRWLSLLESSRIVYLLRPWYRNTGKRIIKSPKLYFADTGLAAWLLRYTDGGQLEAGPMRGPMFENFLIMEILKRKMNHLEMYELYFYRDSNGNEIDLVLEYADKTLLIEIKSARTLRPEFAGTLTRLSGLFPQPHAVVLTLAAERQPLPGGVTGLPWQELFGLLEEKHTLK